MKITADLLTEIYEGWKNYIFENPQVEEEAKRRIQICIDCDKFTKMKACKICGCFMPAKCRNLKMHCDLKKW